MNTSYINPARKLIWHVDHVAAIKNGRKPPPVNVEIDLSNRCSLGCEWCHFGYTHTKGLLAGQMEKPPESIPGGDLMPYDLARAIMDQLYTNGVQSITWTGGGEPTLHPRFNDIVSACPLSQGIYTHGGHIVGDRVKLLKERMAWIYISLDESNARDYRAYKGVDYFDRVCHNVRELTTIAGGAIVGLGFMVHSENYTHIPEMVRLGQNLGVDYVQFRPTIRYSQEIPDTPAEYTNWLDQAIPYLRAYKDDPFIHADVSRFEMYRHWRRGYETCYWTQMQTVITPNGKVWSCVNKREHAGALLGDLSQESFSEVWQRSGACQVDKDCRVLCRGHLPNLTLNEMMKEPIHKEFI